MDSSDNCQNRRSRRSQVLLTAELEHAGECLSVKLRNLSSEGALVESDKLPLEGTPVEFRRNELQAAGRPIGVTLWWLEQTGRLRFEQGRLDEAEEKLRAVLTQSAAFLPDESG